MPGYGAVGRFGVAGWRLDIELVSMLPAAGLALTEFQTLVASGVVVEVAPADLVLSELDTDPQAGARVDAELAADAVLDGPAYVASEGTAVTYELAAAPIELAEVASDIKTGATVDLRLPRAGVRVSTVGGWAVGAGPTAYSERPLNASAPAYAPQAGATVGVETSDLVLVAPAYEIGARRKPVRGQFMIYN